MGRRRILRGACLLVCAAVLAGLPWPPPAADRLPGTQVRAQRLIRIWSLGSIGGGDAWLKGCLRAWEKAHPGCRTYLRTVSPGELVRPGAVLPDLVLFTPGDIAAPQAFLTPLAPPAGLMEPLMRCGRWQLAQYGLPLCYGAYVLAIDGALEPELAATPTPGALLGRPSVTPAPAEPAPGYPIEAALTHALPLAAEAGFGLMTLAALLPPGSRPPLAAPCAAQQDVYRAFTGRTCASALLTTGQYTAFGSLTAAGGGFAVRTMLPDEVITDQVLLGGLCSGASEDAAALLAFLVSPEAQSQLTGQGLHTVREDLRLYASGVEAGVEAASRRSLTVLNAFVPEDAAAAAAWRAYQGSESLSDALAPLI